MATNWATLDSRLTTGLGLATPPIAITFCSDVPADVPPFSDSMPAAKADGRTGRVSAGCVFWMKSVDRTFSTVAADHANCSVGSVTHGFKQLGEVMANEDVAALLECDWVSEDVVTQIPTVQNRPSAVVYGPLAETPHDPDVVLLRVTGRQLMVLHDAVPDLRIEGKPQCHIIAIAKEQGEIAASGRLPALPCPHRDAERRSDLRDPSDPLGGHRGPGRAGRRCRRRCSCICIRGHETLRSGLEQDSRRLPAGRPRIAHDVLCQVSGSAVWFRTVAAPKSLTRTQGYADALGAARAAQTFADQPSSRSRDASSFLTLLTRADAGAYTSASSAGGYEHVLQRAYIAWSFLQPGIARAIIENHRHAIMNRGHEIVRMCGDDCKCALAIAGGIPCLEQALRTRSGHRRVGETRAVPDGPWGRATRRTRPLG